MPALAYFALAVLGLAVTAAAFAAHVWYVVPILAGLAWLATVAAEVRSSRHEADAVQERRRRSMVQRTG